MVEETSSPPSPQGGPFEPTHYIVASKVGDKTTYLLCQRVLAVLPHQIMPGLAEADIADYFRRNGVPAVPVPFTLKGLSVTEAARPQTGVNIGTIDIHGNATINFNDDNISPEPHEPK